MRSRRRVAITGIGLVTPVGNDTATTWSALVNGRSGCAEIRGFEAGGFATRIGAEVKNFDAGATIRDRRQLKFTSPAQRFALVAAEEALRDAGIRPEPATSHRWGFSTGAGMMGITFEDFRQVHAFAAADGEFHPDGLLDPSFPADPIGFCRSQANLGLGLLTRQFGIRGPATAVHTACASGGQALGTALKYIRRGRADFMLAGGYDSMLTPLGLSAFCLLGALSTDNDTPERASRPFDATRNGFVLGEGAGFLVLEEWEAARARGAHIYAELAGDGNSLSCYRITDSPPDGDGPIQAMRQALLDAGMESDNIDYVNAHGTSTVMNDRSECAAMRVVMGSHIDKVLVSSTKSCMGHLIAAAGAVEAAICALAIKGQLAPVNANLLTPDPDCDVNIVQGESRPTRIRAAMSNSLGFGGSNSTLVFRHPDDVEASLSRAGSA
ncbi:MAG: beta-ketoacyl-[acyl-carrier-protein] synthase family protein [Candidatus Eisenbacteria bacterium]|nr:beta-ketoacyl-[acyl-carrier-protein] synthase family protein [Candidatus Eisenbacteria bacterium]